MSSVTEAPSLFLRNATGLVKGWSGFDAFGYSFMSVNLVCLGMFYSLAVFAFVPNGSVLSALLLSGVVMTFLCVTYAGLIAVMPRAGGDYVWQTRILDGLPGTVLGAIVGGATAYLVAQAIGLATAGAALAGVLGVVGGGVLGRKRGGIGFVLSATGWWFILALWAPIYGFILNIEVLQPLAALAGSQDALTFLSSSAGTFTVSVVTIVLASGAVALGMAGYARVQRWCIWLGLAMLALMFGIMLVSSKETFHAAFDSASKSLFGVPDAYNATIANATANDGFVAGGSPLNFGLGSDTFLLLPLMMFWILYPNWGATLYGEVRGAGDFRKVLRGMLGGLWVTIGLAVAFVLLASKTFGWDFFNAQNANYINSAYGYVTTAPTLPIWGYPPLLVSYLIDNRIIQMAIVILFGAWFVGWAGTLWLSSTRMIFAAAFDRVLPEAAARVSDRGVPWIALLLIMVPGVIVSYLYSYVDQLLQAHPRCFAGDRGHVLRDVVRRDDPALVEARPVRQVTNCQVQRGRPADDQRRRGDHHDLPRLDDLRVAVQLAVRDRRHQHPIDHLPRVRVWPRGACLGHRPALPALPGDRPRRDPRGDPGRVTAAARSGGSATSLPTGFFMPRGWRAPWRPMSANGGQRPDLGPQLPDRSLVKA